MIIQLFSGRLPKARREKNSKTCKSGSVARSKYVCTIILQYLEDALYHIIICNAICIVIEILMLSSSRMLQIISPAIDMIELMYVGVLDDSCLYCNLISV